ncbi:hypothetical protein CR513_51229, partial [Mucuna pruriens]
MPCGWRTETPIVEEHEQQNATYNKVAKVGLSYGDDTQFRIMLGLNPKHLELSNPSWLVSEHLTLRKSYNPWRNDSVSWRVEISMDWKSWTYAWSWMLPMDFKTPEFDNYKGSSCPRVHLAMYCLKMATYIYDDKILVHCFQDSLIGAALSWYVSLERWHVKTWRDLAEAFLK